MHCALFLIIAAFALHPAHLAAQGAAPTRADAARQAVELVFPPAYIEAFLQAASAVPDAPPGSWYAPYVEILRQNNVIQSAAFRPHDPITGRSFMYMLLMLERVDPQVVTMHPNAGVLAQAMVLDTPLSSEALNTLKQAYQAVRTDLLTNTAAQSNTATAHLRTLLQATEAPLHFGTQLQQALERFQGVISTFVRP